MTDNTPPSFEGPQNFSSQPSAAGVPTQDDKTWALIAHLGQIVFWVIVPLVVMLTKGKESQWVRTQSTEALNFSITVTIVGLVISIVTLGLGAILVGIYILVFAIIAAIKSYNGEDYRYPLILRLVK